MRAAFMTVRIETELVSVIEQIAHQQRRTRSAVARDLLIEALAARRYAEAMAEMATWPKREEVNLEVALNP